MPREPRWVPRAAVDVIHFDQLRLHGGLPGVRDDGALDSALARARNAYAYGKVTDLPRLAAAYGYAIASAHPFTDGNKRTAFLVMLVFLGLNGADFAAPEAEVVTTMQALAAGEMSEEALAEWIGRWVR